MYRYVCVSMVVLLVLMSKFTKSIKRLNDKVKELASGEGDLTKKIDIYSRDEIGEIAGYVNQFIDQIRMLVKDVSNSIEGIRKAGEELGVTVNDNTQIMSHMNREIEDIGANMEKSELSSKSMSENLADSAEHITTFAENVEAICKVVRQANENAQRTSLQAKENRQNAMNSIKELQVRMEKTSQDTQKIMQSAILKKKRAAKVLADCPTLFCLTAEAVR